MLKTIGCLTAGAAMIAMTAMIPDARAETTTIRVALKDLTTSNPQDVAHIERIEKALAEQGHDIDVEIVDLPGSGYADALTLKLLSGDIPDLIYFQGGDEQIANQGILEDWRPLLEQTEHLKAGLWPHNVQRLENYPYLLYPFPARTKSPLIRADWLEQTGLDAPQTLDEWTQLLRVIADSDFDADGQKNTYGIITPDNTKELDAVFNRAFGINASWLKNDDGEWIDRRVSNQEREKLRYYRMLFADGLLDPEFITSNWEIKEDKFYTGRVGVVMGTAGPVVGIYGAKMKQLHPDAELQLLDPPAGVDQGLEAVDVAKESRGFAISTRSENKEAVLAFVDFLASPQGQMFERMGFEGQHHTRDGDTYAITEEMGTWYPRFFSINPEAWQPPVDILSPVAQASLQQGLEYFIADNAFVWPSELAAEVDAAENHYRTNVFRFISGELSLDDDWDEYVQGWNDAGGQRMTEHARTVLQ